MKSLVQICCEISGSISHNNLNLNDRRQVYLISSWIRRKSEKTLVFTSICNERFERPKLGIPSQFFPIGHYFWNSVHYFLSAVLIIPWWLQARNSLRLLRGPQSHPPLEPRCFMHHKYLHFLALQQIHDFQTSQKYLPSFPSLAKRPSSSTRCVRNIFSKLWIRAVLVPLKSFSNRPAGLCESERGSYRSSHPAPSTSPRFVWGCSHHPP